MKQNSKFLFVTTICLVALLQSFVVSQEFMMSDDIDQMSPENARLLQDDGSLDSTADTDDNSGD